MSLPRPLVAYLRTAEDARLPIAREADHRVALMPEAASVLESSGLDHAIPADLRDPVQFRAWGRDAHERRTSFILAIDDQLARALPEFRAAGFHPIRALAHAFTCLHESVLFATHLLEESFRILKPGTAWIAPAPPTRRVRWPPLPLPDAPVLTGRIARFLHGPGHPPLPRPELYFRESLYALLLPPLSRHAGVRVVEGAILPESPSASLPPVLEELPGGRIEPDSWLFASPSYELAPFREDRMRRGLPSLYAPDLVREAPGSYRGFTLRRRLARLFHRLVARDASFEALFGPSGPALRGTLEARLEYLFLGLVPAYWHSHLAARRILERAKPEVVIGGSTGYLSEMAFLPAAASLGIPRVQYCHGWSQTPYPFAWEQLPEADLYLTWEDPERGSCGSERVRRRAVAVGSSRLQSLALRKAPEQVAAIRASWRRADRPVVLYVPNWVEYSRRWVNCPEEPVWQYRFQRRLFELFSRHPGIDVIWKPLLPWGFHPEHFRRPLPDHIRLVTDTPPSTLAWAADLVVLDAISSPFAEAALTRAPIVILCRNPELEVSDYDLSLVGRRADVHRDVESFFRRLEELMAAGEFPQLENPDDSFLVDKHVDPGAFDAGGASGPATRAASAVSELLRARSTMGA